MNQLFSSLFGKPKNVVKIFEGLDSPMPNFQIVATNVRPGQVPRNYILNDGNQLALVVEKWQFEPGGEVGRCGYDYQIVFINGDLSIPISICFLCKILIFNHSEVYSISKKQIMALLEADFKSL